MDVLEKERQRRRGSRSLFSTLALYAAMGALAVFFAWVLVNWLSGCGQTFPTHTGERVPGECFLMEPTKELSEKREHERAD